MTMGKPHKPKGDAALPALNVNKIQWAEVQRLQETFHLNSVEHGFYDEVDMTNLEVVGNKLMLIVGEVSEAHEELRKHPATHIYYREDGKPEGLPFELADVVIRVADLAEYLGVDLGGVIAEKMGYNAGRPRMHGGKVF